MTLTVRLKPELESALELHCAQRGVSKSLVVQEVLAEYLARPATAAADKRPASAQPASANYRAFEALGLVGTGDLGPRSADKARVREAADARLAARKARRAP